MRIALVRNHDACVNTRQIQLMQKRAGVLPHLGLGYIETAARKRGHTVITIDAQAQRLDAEGLRRAIREFSPGLVGVTTTTPGVPGAIEACKIAKELGAVVILGGPHTEVFGVENLYHECIDYVGVGEGCTIIPDLADRLQSGGSPSEVSGLIGREFRNTPAPMRALEEIGWPSRESVPLSLYHSIMARHPFATMISSRGCPFQCSFCFKQAVDRKSVYRSADDVVSEMEYLVAAHGVREIMFYDDVFTMKRKRVEEICALIGKRGLRVRWEAPTRVDLVDARLLKMMARAGCVRLRFGIESGDPGILKRMQKNTDMVEIEAAVRAAKKAGIQTFAYFIVGWLDETEEEYERTISLAKRLPLDYASFYTATPLPGTRLFRESVAAGRIDSDYWIKYIRGDTTERIRLLADNAEQRSRRAYREFYLRMRKVPTLARHAMHRNSFAAVVTGIAGLMRSNTNAVRDF